MTTNQCKDPQDDPAQGTDELHALRTRNQYLEALARLSGELINSPEISAVFPAICQQVLELTHADSVYIALLSHDQQFLDLKYFAHSRERPTLKRMKRTEGVGGKAISENRFVRILEYQDFAEKVQHVTGIESAIGLPIRQNSESYGALTLLFTNREQALAIEPDLLEMFSAFASDVLENAALKHRMQQERDMQSAMLDINSAMHKSDSLSGIINSVCTRIMYTFDTARVRIYKYQNGDYIEKSSLRFQQGSVKKEAATDSKLLKDSAVQWVMDNQQATLLEQGTKSAKESDSALDYRIKMKLGCTYIMPLMVSGTCWGALNVHRAKDSQLFRPFETRLLDLMASQLSIAIGRQQLIEDIEYDATHDQLTGLYNRASLNSRLQTLTATTNASIQPVTLLYIDLDGFKSVNDEYGHSVGDQLLHSAAKRIESRLDGQSTIYRIGGDEFVVLIESEYEESLVNTIAKGICKSLDQDFVVEDIMLRLSTSIGVAAQPLHTSNPDQLLAYADIAMYHAKRTGGGQVALYDEASGERHKKGVTLKTALKKARHNDEFDLFFQPKVSCKTGQVESVEALARWHHPEHGIVSPAEWIPFAEQTGEIHKIGELLLNCACHWQSRFKENDLFINMAVNVSTPQLEADNFIDMLMSSVKRFAVAPESIEIEITESVMAANLDEVSKKLQQISKNGFKIALDDFGTGYSSLRYLQHLPLDVLKIDRSFIRDLEFEHGAFLAQTVMSIAESLELETVAEGVETSNQIDQVVALGVDIIQGYFYSKPVSGDELLGVIKTINSDEGNPLKSLKHQKAA